MRCAMDHTEIHVLDLDASMAFYERAFGLSRVRAAGPEDGSWKLVFLGSEEGGHLLELTWNAGRIEPYDNGGGDIHLAMRVDDIDAARALHEQMGVICHENKDLGIYFVQDPDGFWIEVIPER